MKKYVAPMLFVENLKDDIITESGRWHENEWYEYAKNGNSENNQNCWNTGAEGATGQVFTMDGWSFFCV